jgi:hypothetical protein
MAANKTGTQCRHCGADEVKNPHTGKVFCSAKCWLKKGQPAPAKQEPETDWDEVNQQKAERIWWGEAWKLATQITCTMDINNHGGSIGDVLHRRATMIYHEMEKVPYDHTAPKSAPPPLPDEPQHDPNDPESLPF